MKAECPMPGMAKLLSNRSPKTSTIVRISTVNPQNVKACASPGSVHLSSLR